MFNFNFSSVRSERSAEVASHVKTTPFDPPVMTLYDNVIENKEVKRKFCDEQVPNAKQ